MWWIMSLFAAVILASIAKELMIVRARQRKIHTKAAFNRAFPTCIHGELIEVESGGEIVAYICGDCDEQVDVDAPAATRYRVQKRIETGFSDMVQSLNEDKANLQRTIDASGRQTNEQAKRFAARTQQFDQGGHVPPATYVNVMPDLSNFKGRIPPKQDSLRIKRSPKGSWM